MYPFTELAFLKYLVYSKNSLNTENTILGKTDKDSCPMNLSCTVGIQVVNLASKLIIHVTEDYWCYGKNKRQKDGVGSTAEGHNIKLCVVRERPS